MAMNTFEYLGVLVSVLLGLAITHLVVGTVSIIQNRETTQVYWVHLVWVGNAIILITQFWWFFFGWSGLDLWPMSIFYLLFCYALVLSASAALLFPVREMAADYRAYYYKQFRWFFFFLLLAVCLDIAEVAVKATAELRPIPAEYFPLTIPILIGVLVAILTGNPKYHAFFVLAFLILNSLYSILIFSALG